MKKVILIILLILVLGSFSLASVSALSIVTHISEKYHEVAAGERFYFEIEVTYPENLQRKDLRLNYEILTQDGKIIAQSQVLKAIETQASFIDFIIIPESAKKGMHVIKIKISDYEGLSKEVETSFYVTPEKGEQIKIYFFILLGAIILTGGLVVLSIIFNRRR